MSDATHSWRAGLAPSARRRLWPLTLALLLAWKSRGITLNLPTPQLADNDITGGLGALSKRLTNPVHRLTSVRAGGGGFGGGAELVGEGLGCLRVLRLNQNRLEGPSKLGSGGIGGPPPLTSCQLTVPTNLPQSILAIEVLDLSSNSLTGGLPHGMYRLRQLQVLRLDGNHGLETQEYAEGLREALVVCRDMRL